jgi:hypothetical protein
MKTMGWWAVAAVGMAGCNGSQGGGQPAGDDCEDCLHCSFDGTIACAGDGTGFDCPVGEQQLVWTVANTLCTPPSPEGDGAGETYCCVDTSTPTTCASATVPGCLAQSYGVSCTGTDTPGKAVPGFTECTAADAGAGGETTLYCCQ